MSNPFKEFVSGQTQQALAHQQRIYGVSSVEAAFTEEELRVAGDYQASQVIISDVEIVGDVQAANQSEAALNAPNVANWQRTPIPAIVRIPNPVYPPDSRGSGIISG